MQTIAKMDWKTINKANQKFGSLFFEAARKVRDLVVMSSMYLYTYSSQNEAHFLRYFALISMRDQALKKDQIILFS